MMAISDISVNDESYNIIHDLFLFRGVDKIVFDKAMSGNNFYINKYMPGEIIYEPSRFEHSLGVILTGSAKIATADGIKNVILRTLGAGSVFGAASLFGDDNKYVTQITAKGTTTAAFFTQTAINEIITADRAAALNYINFLSDRIRFCKRRVRICAYL
jgi:CRP-like cAMP-binding protein